AAKPMRDYYETLENAFDNAAAHGHEDAILPLVYTPAVMAGLATDMKKAEAAALTDAEKSHVRLERLMFDHLAMYAKSLTAKQELRFTEAAGLMRQMEALKLKMREICP